MRYNHRTDRSPNNEADVCIVGSGPAGALVAHVLAERGHEVVVLEAGKRFDRSKRLEQMERAIRPTFHPYSVWGVDDELDAYTNSGRVDYPVNYHRVKGVGGSTLHWGSNVARLRETTFEQQTRWGISTDWPISYSDLRPYYAEAERELGVSSAEDNPFSPPRESSYPLEPFPRSRSDEIFDVACQKVNIKTHSTASARNSDTYDGRSRCVGYGTCSPVCPSGAKYSADIHIQKAETEGARVIDQAVVQRLRTNSRGTRVIGAVYRTPNDKEYTQTADKFVLAAGGVENPRLLLLSRSSSHPNGLANSSGTVGHYLMDHLYTLIMGELDTETYQHAGTPVGIKSHQFAEPDDVPPGAFKLEFGNGGGPTLTDIALNQRQPLRHISNLLANPAEVNSWQQSGRDVAQIKWGDDLLETIQQQYGNHFILRASIEVLPYSENRVTLNQEKTDVHGNPVPDIHWGHWEEYEEATIERSFEVMEQIVSNLEPSVQWTQRETVTAGAAHPSGTTRMGDDPESSVVDRNLKAHDLKNLYISGSSVFTSGGCMQPTLTIAALSLRLGNHLHDLVLSK